MSDKYRCTKCGTLWVQNHVQPPDLSHLDGTWSLFDAAQKPGECCDNNPDFLYVIESVQDAGQPFALMNKCTPRTDTASYIVWANDPIGNHIAIDEVVNIEVSRQLERELSAAQVQIVAQDGMVMVPEGESRWLIETTIFAQLNGPQRHFWTGTGWNYDAMHAARYSTERIAKDVAENEKMYPLDKYPICEHLFQCGVSK